MTSQLAKVILFVALPLAAANSPKVVVDPTVDSVPSLLSITGHFPDLDRPTKQSGSDPELQKKEQDEDNALENLKKTSQAAEKERIEAEKRLQKAKQQEQQALENTKKIHEQKLEALNKDFDKEIQEAVGTHSGATQSTNTKPETEGRTKKGGTEPTKSHATTQPSNPQATPIKQQTDPEGKPLVPAAGDAVVKAGGDIGKAIKKHKPSKMDHIRALVVFACILTFMLIIGGVMLCVMYAVLKFLQPKRPKTEEEAKAIIDDLKKQRDALLERDQELQKQVEDVQEKIDEQRHHREAQQGGEEGTNPDSEAPASVPRRLTRRESVGQQPFLNPDGTYTMPDISQFAENERLRSMKEAFSPILDKREKIRDALLDRKEVAVQKAHDILVAELKDAYEDVREASLQTSNPTQMLLGVADLPPIALLLAGMCVPMQLKSLLWFTMLDLTIKMILFILTIVALWTEYGVKCLSVMRDAGLQQWILGEATGEVGKRHWVYPWMEVDAASLFVQIMIRFAIMRLVNMTLQEVDDANEEQQKVPESENLLEAFQHLVDHALSSCGTTMLCYDRVVSSWPFWLLNFIAFFDFSWQIYGLTFLFNTPNYECQATLMRTVFRVRAVTFMLFLTWHVGVLLNAAMSMMVHSQSFTNTVVSIARKFDEDFSPPWLPICTILVRAFFARDQTDLDKMELRILRAQKRKLEHRQRLSMKRQEELSKQEQNLDEQLQAIAEKQRETMGSGDTNLQAQFLDEHRKKIEGIFNKVDVIMKTVKENQARANAAEAMIAEGAVAASQGAAAAQSASSAAGSAVTSSSQGIKQALLEQTRKSQPQ
eukprot:gnl/MRDRNA2_/MRDRNA2_123565_c0_seq1.p1 gnl/MRDRNA2_/MRDRNA2_123565_c0~~gnl/MRDRNA2_/MRDRNA2_123565_c0_seq1.p1  ORF type:complete len:825 (+),score=213.86 gnl/MRDRNA2_/MRDRNA2_123565_c0_seq1:148-2622(+)